MTSRDELIGQYLTRALTFTRLAQVTRSVEMLTQHLDAIERLLELAISVSDTDAATPPA